MISDWYNGPRTMVAKHIIEAIKAYLKEINSECISDNKDSVGEIKLIRPINSSSKIFGCEYSEGLEKELSLKDLQHSICEFSKHPNVTHFDIEWETC